MNYIESHLEETVEIINKIESSDIEKMVDILFETREKKGRLFILGVGGSAANASHAVNDFRKLCSFEAYSPTDNVSELTARTNDEGWDTVFKEWLKISNLSSNDCLLILSVGGGDAKNNVSPNLVNAIDFAKSNKTRIIGIVGRNGGYTLKNSDACCLIPVVNQNNITPHSEAFQAIIWHAIVSHPKIKINETKWESIE